MDLSLSSEQQMLRESAQRWVAERDRAPAPAGTPAFMPDWRQMAEFGWLAMTLPEDDGGLGQSLADACLLAECLGAGPVSSPYIPAVIQAGELLASRGSRGQRERWLAALAEGKALPVIAHIERDAGHRLDRVSTRAVRDGNGWRIDGAKSMVPFGQAADAWIVSAKVDGAIALFVVERGTVGVTERAFETVDGAGACRLTLAGVRVDDAARLPGATLADLERVTDHGLLAACAESVGAMDVLVKTTVEYTRTRVQFGKPLAVNQVLRHRMVDMWIAAGEARAVLSGALITVAQAQVRGDAAARARAAAGARAKVGACARRVAEEAIQLHGGMGVTQELNVGVFLRRQVALDAEQGGAEWHLRRHSTMAPVGDLAMPMSDEDAAFRDEVLAFLDENLTPEIARGTRVTTSVFSEPDVGIPWNRVLNKRGWVAPAWPKEYGGTGWTLMQRWIFENEFARAGTPSLSPMGLKMAGPVIMKFGTPEQKAYYLPRMLNGDDYWCQGYSEPGSGSDLASLKTRAARDGDHYVVSGSKIWTTHAHFANLMFALVRTGVDEVRKQDGISFLLIDMKTPGITVRPIQGVGGDHEVNQVFFDDVRVPVANRVGDEGQGWTIAKYLLEFERGGSITSGGLRARLATMRELAAGIPRGDASAAQDPDIALALSQVELDVDAQEMTELRVMSSLSTGQNPGSVSSVMKLRWSEIHQAQTRLATRILGPDAMAWESRRPLYTTDETAVLEELARPVTVEYLNSRAFTIFGGSSEVQHEIIAKGLVG